MYKIEPLEPSHDREGFDCGSEELNRFLKQTARQHVERGLSQTYVLVLDDDPAAKKAIFGFFTVTVCEVPSDTLPPERARKFPRAVPAALLGRLAVARSHRRQGLGADLLAAAMRKCRSVFETIGGIGLFVNAKDEVARRFYERFGFVRLPPSDMRLFLPRKLLLKLVDPG